MAFRRGENSADARAFAIVVAEVLLMTRSYLLGMAKKSKKR
jgi:hypothetical protein